MRENHSENDGLHIVGACESVGDVRVKALDMACSDSSESLFFYYITQVLLNFSNNACPVAGGSLSKECCSRVPG